jgi:release factor glutamine methyltransferase
MVRLKEFRNRLIAQLNAVYPGKEGANIIHILFSDIAGIDPKDIQLNPDRVISQELESKLTVCAEELLKNKPVQYVTGKAFFYDLELEMNPSVLIPRPETEELVKWIVDDHKNVDSLRILDIGTGSGCIILALGKLLQVPDLTAIDNSKEALLTAGRNAGKNSLTVNFMLIDILDKQQWGKLGQFDIIVSNPPYVRDSEKQLMKPNVLNYEPDSALFVPDDDPLVFYHAIAKFAKSHLQDGGKLYVEINENLGNDVLQLFIDEGFFDVILRKDFHGKDRLVCGSKPFMNHIGT